MKVANKLLIICLAILTVAMCMTFLPIHGESEIYDSVVRLHVLASSDSTEDQTLKLRVRDRILEYTAETLRDCGSRDEAQARLGALLPEIESICREQIKADGYDYDVSVKLDKEYYPTRQYDSCSFPEGSYLSLRVIIGEGEGQNWWCCLFPPLCLSGAKNTQKNEDAFISVGLTDDQYKIITQTDAPKYKVRFKLLEIIQGLFG